MRTPALLLLSLLSLPTLAEKAKLPGLLVPDGLGVNIHFTDPKPGEMKMLAEAGFKFIRMDFGWGGTERKKGEYDFSAYDRLMSALDEHKIRAVFILDYSNKNYDNGLSPNSDEGRAAFAAWSAAAAKHFAGRGIVWEMYNEPNIHFWKPKPKVDDYAKLALVVGKALRAAAPDELYVGPATSEIDLKFLEACFKAGCLEYWDAVSVHPYRQKDPETVCEEYRNLRLMIAKYAPKGKTIPILSGEWGYSAAWGKFDETRQGKYLPRQWLVNLYNQVPISIWYDWHDDGKDSKEPEHHFGTVNNDYLKGQSPVYEPKDAYKSAKTLTTQLAGYKYNKRLWTGEEGDWVLLFTKGEEVKVVAWTTGKEHEIWIPASPSKFGVIGYTGEELGQVSSVGMGGFKLTLTDTVKYVTPAEKNDLLRVAAAWERAPLEVVQKAPAGAHLELAITNPLDHAVWMNLGNGAQKLEPGQEFKRDPRSGRTVILLGRTSNLTEKVQAWLDCDGAAGYLQMSTWQVSNPVRIEISGPVNGTVGVLMLNPSAQSFSATSVVESGEKQYPLQIALKDGETERWMTVGSIAEPSQVVFKIKERLFVEHDAETVIRKGFRSIRLDAGNLELKPDGDAKVKSTQSIASQEAPELPTGQKVETLKLTYSFDPGWKFIRLVPSKEDLKKIEGKPKQLGLWVYGDDSANVVRLRFADAQGQVFQPSGFTLNFKGWKWVTIPMDGSDAAHWGKGDGAIQYPIRWDSLLLIDSAHKQKTSGEIWIAGMTLIE